MWRENRQEANRSPAVIRWTLLRARLGSKQLKTKLYSELDRLLGARMRFIIPYKLSSERLGARKSSLSRRLSLLWQLRIHHDIRLLSCRVKVRD